MQFFLRLAQTLPLLAAIVFAPSALADEKPNNQQPCPVLPYDGVTPLDTEFGEGSQAITHCLKVRHNAKVVISVSHPFFFNAFGAFQKSRATFFSNLDHLTRNYENMHAMTVGKDVNIVVVLVESGGVLAATQHNVFAQANLGVAANPFIPLVEAAKAKGIKIYLCQTAARNLGITRANMIPGIEFVPGGHIAVADFQLRGYAVLNP